MEEKRLRAGVIGLGMIGGGIAVSLARSGRVPAVYDVREDATDQLEGVPPCLDSPAEVARRSDVVMICVVNASQVYSVLLGEGGLLLGAHEHLTVCLISTVGLDDVRKIRNLCETHGAAFIDCGVTPGNLAAKHGMTAMAGAKETVLDAAAPVLNDWAKKIVHCGPAGAGMAMKLARNVVTFGGWRMVKEAQKLAEAAGIRHEKLLEVLEEGDPDGRLLLSNLRLADRQGKVPEHLSGKILPLMKKDLTAACKLANELGVELAGTKAAKEYAGETMDTLEVSGMEEVRERGAAAADLIFGNDMGNHLQQNEKGNPYNDATLENVFGNLWLRDGLSIHERRLLVMGVAAAQGRSDLIHIQALGALENQEMSPKQLDEAALQLAVYAGWCNGGAAAKGIAGAKKIYSKKQENLERKKACQTL